MRPHGHFTADQEAPRAKGVCDFCGFIYQLEDLRWNFEWVGPRLQNQRVLVCRTCNDKPQEQLRTIVLPPDPVPVLNARPEYYVQDDNPGSALGVSANFAKPTIGSRVGSLTGCGGINAAFDGNINKQSYLSAANKTVSDSSFNNYVGINWQGGINNPSTPSSLVAPVIQHSLSSFSVYAPRDSAFLHNAGTSWVVQCAPADTTLFAAWTTIASGTTLGTQGESFTLTLTSTYINPLSQYHRVAFLGDGTNYVSIAQVQFSVFELGGTGES